MSSEIPNEKFVRECWDVSRIIACTCESYFEEVREECEAYGPKTTPEAPIWWGLPSRFDGVLESDEGLITFQRGIFFTLFKFCKAHSHLGDGRWDFMHSYEFMKREGGEAYLYKESEGVDLRERTTTGAVKPDKKIVWTNNVPQSLVDSLKSKIKNYYDERDSSVVKELFIRFPEYYNNLKNTEAGNVLDGRKEDQFRAIIAHELTHMYIVQNSILRDKYLKAVGGQASPTKIVDLNDVTINQDEMARQANQVAFNPAMEVIEEAFAFEVTRLYYSDFDLPKEGYELGEKLPWLTNLIKDKIGRKNPEETLDFLRMEAASILDQAARKGQIDYKGKRKTPLVYFLDNMIHPKTSEMLGDFKNTYYPLWRILDQNPKLKNIFENQISANYSSFEPEKLNQELKLDVYSKAIEEENQISQIHALFEERIYEFLKAFETIESKVRESNTQIEGMKQVDDAMKNFAESYIN